MKGIVVMQRPCMPDIVFLTADKAFTSHMNQLAVKKKLIKKEDVDQDHVDISMATQFFSPIAASYASLSNEIHLPYSSIRTENDFLFVLKQCGDHLYIAVNGDGTESELFLNHKLQVLHQLVKFYYGPITDQLKPETISEKQRLWEEMARLIDTWAELYNKEQCFLVEAIERLQVNQTVNEICIGALEMVLRKLRSVGQKYAVHAMLMVDAKLLALYSSRKASELQSSDILITTLVAQSFYPTRETLDSLMGQNSAACDWPESSGVSQQPSSDEFLSAEGASGGESSYYSPNDSENGTSDIEATPGNDSIEGRSGPITADPTVRSRPITASPMTRRPHQATPSSDSSSDGETDRSKDERFFTPPVSVSPSKRKRKPQRARASSGKDTPQAAAVAATVSPGVSLIANDKKDCVRMAAFLKLAYCSCAPHVLQFVPVFPGTTMVIVSQVKVELAKLISDALYILNMICQTSDSSEIYTGSSQRSLTESLENIIKQVCEHAKKFRTSDMHKNQSLLKDCWHNVKRFGLQTYLDSINMSEMSPRLESALSELSRLLKVFFKTRYCNVKTRPENVSKQYAEAIKQCQRLLRESLVHYQQYLSIKAQRNITMTAYLEDFPGLVHFIHVDRKTDQITAPSLGVMGTVNEGTTGPNPASLVKEKVWHIVPMMHEYLMQGYYTAAVRQGDFYCSYYLYFEDVTGKLVAAQRPMKTDNTDIPGILTGAFFKDLVHRCFPGIPVGMVRCCELLCIHLAVVPIQYVTAHARRLCASLWETSGEVATPVNLL